MKKRKKNINKSYNNNLLIKVGILILIFLLILIGLYLGYKTANVVSGDCTDTDSTTIPPVFDENSLFKKGSSFNSNTKLTDKCFREDIIQEAICRKSFFKYIPVYTKKECPSGTLCIPGLNKEGASCIQSNVCGNGIIEGTEKCEGNNLNGQTCSLLGFLSGELKCLSECQFDTSNCISKIGYTCIDTDKGINISLNGTVTEYFNGAFRQQRKDGCLIAGSNNPAYPSGRLLEFYCNNSRMASIQINCTRGVQCREGKCLM